MVINLVKSFVMIQYLIMLLSNYFSLHNCWLLARRLLALGHVKLPLTIKNSSFLIVTD